MACIYINLFRFPWVYPRLPIMRLTPNRSPRMQSVPSPTRRPLLSRSKHNFWRKIVLPIHEKFTWTTATRYVYYLMLVPPVQLRARNYYLTILECRLPTPCLKSFKFFYADFPIRPLSNINILINKFNKSLGYSTGT